MNKTLRIKLLSDLCTGSGDGFAGVVDADICYDDYGLPYIPAKRIKGCLRECALEIINVDSSLSDQYEALFGKIGGDRSVGLKLGSGRLNGYENLINEAKTHSYSHDEVLDCFTDIRRQTKMKNGFTVDGSLRFTRVVKSGETFYFDCEFPDEYEKFFVRCCNLLRNIGLNRTRGLGEVKSEIIERHSSSDTPNISVTDFDETHKILSYTLYLDEPVISADRFGRTDMCESYIFGGAIQGAIMNMWRKSHGKPDNAHNDTEFHRLFLKGGLIFTAAFPTNGKRIYYHSPNTLKTNKTKDEIFDESNETCSGTEGNPVCKKLEGFAAIEKGNIFTYSVTKEVSIHHSRPANKRIAHSTKNDGNLFNYTAISRGQMFSGAIIGTKNDIRTIYNLLNSSPDFHIGRSITAQFGKVHIDNSENNMPHVSKNEIVVASKNLFKMIIRTPMILNDGSGNDTPDLSLIPEYLGNSNIKVVKSFCTETFIAGYNAKWRLPRRQTRAIAEGSVVILQNCGNTDILLNQTFIGIRNGNGFGQIMLEHLSESVFQFCSDSKNDMDIGVANTYVPVLKPLIDTRKAEEEAKSKSVDYAKQIEGGAPKNTQLSKLKSFLHDREKINEYSSLVEKIMEIKQEKQRLQMLLFCVGDDKRLFEKSVNKDDIIELLSENNESYAEFAIFMSYVIREIRYLRRKK